MTKQILLGVSGGIAAYKIPILVRLLKQADMDVHVVMTRAAKQFVTPMTLATLSGNRVWESMWEDDHSPSVAHISLADKADLAVVAPATANIVGKLAAGVADDMLTTVLMAVQCPVLLCPSMNVNMFRNPMVQRNLRMLRDVGYHILDPDSGFLACGWTGQGRLPEPEDICEAIKRILSPKDLTGLSVLVTAGPTEEPLDPVRFITNRSSGKMGVAIARRAAYRGASVVLVAGPLKVAPPAGVKFIPVRTAQEMLEQVTAYFPSVDVVVKAAAVADFRPSEPRTFKAPKDELGAALPLTKNEDILKTLGEAKKAHQVVIGFAAETLHAVEKARAKLMSKKADMMVVNDVGRPGAGFDSDTNVVSFLFPSGEVEHHDIMMKDAVADLILDRAKALRQAKRG
ncbi:MAG: bifunctional phosphopantothenoylcysteine decarboxylase/phosphopantothenate--cysteine ligase CoaBC [Desulfomonilaceae bacterium]